MKEYIKDYWALPAEKQDQMLGIKRPVAVNSRNALDKVFGRRNNTALRRVHRASPRRPQK